MAEQPLPDRQIRDNLLNMLSDLSTLLGGVVATSKPECWFVRPRPRETPGLSFVVSASMVRSMRSTRDD